MISSAYGGFGNTGAGLPGGKSGLGTNPGYPVGTGKSYKLTCTNTVKCIMYKYLYFISAGVGPGGLSPAQAKAAKYGITFSTVYVMFRKSIVSIFFGKL